MESATKITVKGSGHKRGARDIECYVAPERVQSLIVGMIECGYGRAEVVSK